MAFCSFLFMGVGGKDMKMEADLLLDSPVIAAVKDDTGLEKALQSDCQVIFLLFGTLLNIGQLVQKVHSCDKICFVHIDLIEGLSNRDIAVDCIAQMAAPDGIISTRAPFIRRAQQLGLSAVQRMFLLDSISLKNVITQMEAHRPDYIEVLPGVIPSIIREITEKTSTPLIAGGLIRSKQDVFQALQAGAVAVSTSCQAVWNM